MELFHEYKNRYFNVVFKLLNLSKDGLTKDEILKIIDEEAYEEKIIGKDFITFEGLILNEYKEKFNLNLLKEENNLYYPVIKNDRKLPLAVRFSQLEKQWLKAMLEEKIATELLGEELVRKLEFSLRDVQAISSDIVEKTNQTIYQDIEYKSIKNNFYTIIYAIKNNKVIKYTNINRHGNKYKDKLALPIRIDYSIKDENIRASMYSLDEERTIMVLLKNIKEIEVVDDVKINKTREEIISDLKKRKYCKDPIVLEVIDIRGAMERCFMGFSSYERSTRSLGNNKYEVKIYYYTFNEEELIRRILTLGPYVVVKSPVKIRDKIISILKELDNTFINE